MAKAKITYEYDRKSGNRTIHVDYESDPDMLAREHEKEHRRIVGELVGKGIIAPEDQDDVIIDRAEQPKEQPREQEERVPRRTAQENS